MLTNRYQILESLLKKSWLNLTRKFALRYSTLGDASEVPMSEVLPLSSRIRKRKHLIWLGDTDPAGLPLHPLVKEIAYKKEAVLARYRGSEMKDKAEVANMIEEAVYQTSREAFTQTVTDPGGYLYITYKNSVDRKLRRALKAFDLENGVIDSFAFIDGDAEEEMARTLTRNEVFERMDQTGKALWNRHLFGYDLPAMAAEEGQTVDYLSRRLKRATERALRRLLLNRSR